MSVFFCAQKPIDEENINEEDQPNKDDDEPLDEDSDNDDEDCEESDSSKQPLTEHLLSFYL